MKIAICISGQPRSYKEGFKELKKWFLSKYDCDVYIHTWKDTTTKFISSHNFTETRYYSFTEKDYQNIIDLYQPKSYNFQKPIPFDNNGIIGNLGFTINSILSAWLSTQQSIQQALDSEVEYDLIIKYRFDLDFSKTVSPKCQFLKDVTQCNPEHFHCFSFGIHDEGNYRPTEVDDLFNVGGPKVMETYSQLFSNILSYGYIDKNHINWLVEKTGDPDFLSHESLLKWHLEQNNIYINRVHSLGNKNEYGDKHFTAGIIR